MDGEPFAWLEYGYDEGLGDLDYINSWIDEEYERAYREGYKYVYITHGSTGDDSSIESFEKYILDFSTEYCGGEINFYDLNEASINENLLWN